MKKTKICLMALLLMGVFVIDGYGQGLYKNKEEAPEPTSGSRELYAPPTTNPPDGGGGTDPKDTPIGDTWFLLGSLAFVYGLSKIRKREGRA